MKGLNSGFQEVKLKKQKNHQELLSPQKFKHKHICKWGKSQKSSNCFPKLRFRWNRIFDKYLRKGLPPLKRVPHHHPKLCRSPDPVANCAWKWDGLSMVITYLHYLPTLVGGFNPSEKYMSNWKFSPNRGEHKKYLKPPPSTKCLLATKLVKRWLYKLSIFHIWLCIMAK